jgi:predicted outer membrane repeat protein
MSSLKSIKNILFSALSLTVIISMPSQATEKSAGNIEMINQLKNHISSEHKFNAKGGGLIQSMGSDEDCDINVNVANIQLAIGSGATEIRLANNASYSEDIFISDQSLTIKGGYANCDEANNDNPTSTQTLITGTNSNPVVSISGASETHEIRLENLIITNGNGSDFFPGGGVSTLNSKANIRLKNVVIENNTGIIGGGIALTSGASNLILEDSLIRNNQAHHGGGIHCTSEDASVLILGSSGIVGNTAEQDASFGFGGGIYIDQGCLVTIFSGSSANNTEFGVVSNVAKRHGGGIFLNSGGQLNLQGQQVCVLDVCFGDPTEPVNIGHNLAEDNVFADIYGHGGGLYISGGADTQVSMSGVYFNNNIAHFRGGAIYAGLNVDIVIKREPGPCWDNNRCNYFKANAALNAGFDVDELTYGGAIYNPGSTLDIAHTYFEDNRAHIGTVLYAGQFDSENTFRNSVFNNNGNLGIGLFDDKYVFALYDIFAALNLINTTIADNNATSAVIGRLVQSNLPINIQASIIDDANTGFVISNEVPVLADIDCLVAHEMLSLGNSAVNVQVTDPEFVDRDNRDYHLNAATSPAVDFCAQPLLDDGVTDMDNQQRGWDDNTVQNYQNNQNYIYDAGADETYDNDIIFKDGFSL